MLKKSPICKLNKNAKSCVAITSKEKNNRINLEALRINPQQNVWQKMEQIESQLHAQSQKREFQYNQLYKLLIALKRDIKKKGKAENQQSGNDDIAKRSIVKKLSKNNEQKRPSTLLKTEQEESMCSPLKNRSIIQKVNKKGENKIYLLEEQKSSIVNKNFDKEFECLTNKIEVISKNLTSVTNLLENLTEIKKDSQFKSRLDQQIMIGFERLMSSSKEIENQQKIKNQFENKNKQLNDFLMDQLLQIYQKMKSFEQKFDDIHFKNEITKQNSFKSITSILIGDQFKNEQANVQWNNSNLNKDVSESNSTIQCTTKDKISDHNGAQNRFRSLQNRLERISRQLDIYYSKNMQNEGLILELIQITKQLSKRIEQIQFNSSKMCDSIKSQESLK